MKARYLIVLLAALCAPISAQAAGQVVFSADMAEMGVATAGCTPEVVSAGEWRHKVITCTPGANATFYIPADVAFPPDATNAWTPTFHAQRPTGSTGTSCDIKVNWYAIPNNTAMGFTMNIGASPIVVDMAQTNRRYVVSDAGAIAVQNAGAGACSGLPSVCAGSMVYAIVNIANTGSATSCSFRKVVGNY